MSVNQSDDRICFAMTVLKIGAEGNFDMDVRQKKMLYSDCVLRSDLLYSDCVSSKLDNEECRESGIINV